MTPAAGPSGGGSSPNGGSGSGSGSAGGSSSSGSGSGPSSSGSGGSSPAASVDAARFIYAIQPSGSSINGGVLHDDGSVTSISSGDTDDGTGAFTTGIAADRHGHFLFVSSSGPDDHGSRPPSGTASFIINHSDGSLSRMAPILNFTAPMGADPGGLFVYMMVAGGLDVFAVDQQTGALQRIPDSPFPGPTSGGPLVNNEGSELFTQSNNAIGAWRLNPQTGVPSVVRGSPFSVGESNFSLSAITPDDRMLLISASQKIITMHINDDGSLTRLASTPLTLAEAGSFAIDPTQRYVYFCAQSAGPGYLEGYKLENSGQLTPLPGTPFDTGSCWALNANPSGKYLYAIGGAITYRIDQSTGALTKISQSRAASGFEAVLTP